MSTLEQPYELIFSIDSTSFARSTITINRDGTIIRLGKFPPRNVTVLVLQEDADSIDITDQQYAKMRRLIDYCMYLNPCLEVYFTTCATLWGKEGKNFDGMTFDEILGTQSS